MLIIDIVIPVYNKKKYLGELLDLLLSEQDLYDSIILVDDCSTDGSIDLISEYKERYPQKIRVFLQKENKGPHYARIKGAELSGKDYVMFADADDLFHMDGLRNLLSANVDWMKYGICYGSTFQNYREGCVDKYTLTSDLKELSRPIDLLKYEMPPMIGLLVRKDVVPLMDIGNCFWGEDIIFFIKALMLTPFVYKKETVGVRRIMEGTRGTSGGTFTKRVSFIKSLYSVLVFKNSFSNFVFFMQMSTRTILAWCVKKIR